ncbi:hypothetical protein CVT25_000494 [Psilocybe cyanescens]|uniref:Uncharacterized protein n=1 Tax=Psilocybe cyanescens TaxID=93625 RepID=A0A409XWA4_PSICY|nr:hypothetical protein CVT25_000494 [Psilocybe cyanescens]
MTMDNGVSEGFKSGQIPSALASSPSSVVTRSVTAGPKLLSFNPILDNVPDPRNPSIAALGFAIAPLKNPHFKDTAALHFHITKDDNHAAILTCAHVVCPLLSTPTWA